MVVVSWEYFVYLRVIFWCLIFNCFENIGNSYLILISGVFSVGQLYNCDIYKIMNVQFILLNRDTIDVQDPRITDVNFLFKNRLLNFFSFNVYFQRGYFIMLILAIFEIYLTYLYLHKNEDKEILRILDFFGKNLYFSVKY